MPAVDWNNLRLVLAVAETGSLNAAAARLSVNHTTVLRRLDAIETRLGVRLLERSSAGQALTPVVEGALPALTRMAEAAHDVERLLAGSSTLLVGSLRVTTTDTLAVTLVGDLVTRFRQAHPEVLVELVTSNAFANLTRREADVAIRPAAAVPDTLVGRRAGALRFAIYARAAAADGAAMPWIGLDDSLGYSAAVAWLSAHVGKIVAARYDSLVAARELVAAGMGRTVLPRYLGDADPRLVALDDVDASADLWVLAHVDLARSARVRAFTQFAFEHLRTRLASTTT